MLAKQIVEGGTYRAKVSNKLTTVRVDSILTEASGHTGRYSTRYHVTNLLTGRKLVFRSAGRFHEVSCHHAALQSS